MEKVTGKEGKGVKGTGFDGETGSTSYQQLPRSSNASLGIEADVAAGISDAADAPDSHELNAGPTGEMDNSGNDKFGLQDVADGTVPARRKDDMVNAGPSRGDFGRSAKGGTTNVSEDGYYGSGARKQGTAAAPYGEPGRGGSMALAIKGLSGTTGSTIETQDVGRDAAAATLKSKLDATKGLKGSMKD